jgi:hypothetical protein
MGQVDQEYGPSPQITWTQPKTVKKSKISKNKDKNKINLRKIR